MDFKSIYERLALLQERAFGPNWAKGEEGLDTALQEYAVLSIVEAVELLLETNFKKHKRKKIIDREAARKEIVDMFIYSVDAATQIFDSHEDFLREVVKKMDINDTRKDWIINHDPT